MTQHANRRQPTLNSPTTRQLGAHIRALSRRDTSLDGTIAAIRNGNNHLLHQLVVRAQAGDTNAAITAIWALHPRLCAVVIQRQPMREWRTAIDDYIALAYLTIANVNTAESSAYLADKIIARTRRRHERANEDWQVSSCDEWLLESLGALAEENVETQVLARLELDELVQAVADGLLTNAAWHNLINLRIGRSPDQPATDRERSSLRRAQRRLDNWRAEAA